MHLSLVGYDVSDPFPFCEVCLGQLGETGGWDGLQCYKTHHTAAASGDTYVYVLLLLIPRPTVAFELTAADDQHLSLGNQSSAKRTTDVPSALTSIACL